jgi:hypothetical protein
MSLVGLVSIVFKPASNVWPGETPPSPELAALFDSLPALFELETRNDEAVRDALDAITRLDLQPSQELRRLYWSARRCESHNDHRQAFELFDRVRQLAAEHDDVISTLEMAVSAANAQHDGLLYLDALIAYREALNFWENAKLTRADRRLDTEIQLRDFVCREEWLVGEFDAAHGNLARALTKALKPPKASQSEELRKGTANGLWTLALALRADSDRSDGNLKILKQASKRMLTARNIYRDLGVPHNQLARLDIQLADIYFDLAELHLQRNIAESARSMRSRGVDMANEARDFLARTRDRAAPWLAEIVSLRPDIMWPQCTTPAQIDARLTAIERQAAKMEDQFLIAKAATLRAEWLMSLHEWNKARTTLTLAIEGFSLGGKGMATRAERLMRQLPPMHGPEDGYGGADPERGGHN